MPRHPNALPHTSKEEPIIQMVQGEASTSIHLKVRQSRGIRIREWIGLIQPRILFVQSKKGGRGLSRADKLVVPLIHQGRKNRTRRQPQSLFET